MQGRMSVKKRIANMDIESDNVMCPLCKHGVETLEHVLYSCELSMHVWKKKYRGSNTHSLLIFRSALASFKGVIRPL